MEIPIFPINGAVLFPQTNLPLNIFEKRYIQMVDYSLSKKRLIGMIQTKNNGDIFNIGCVGKITSFNETNDGRYLINLQGLNCFSVNKEIKKKYSFRLVDIKIIKINNKNSIINNNMKKNILESFKHYIGIKKINIKLDELQKLKLDQLVKFITMVSDFDYVDKQMLLEIVDLEVFCEKLL